VDYKITPNHNIRLQASISSLPLTVPEKPILDREVFQHNIKTLIDGIAYDDIYIMNTQSGTQWDGFRHVSYYSH
jgi:hypothetical protein